MSYNSGILNAASAAQLPWKVKQGQIQDRFLVDDAKPNNWTLYDDNAAASGKVAALVFVDANNQLGLLNPFGAYGFGLQLQQLATPSAPTVTPKGTAGATSYSYVVVAKSGAGAVLGNSPASAAGSTSTGNATLSTTNWNRLTITAVPNAAGYDIYRTVGGATQGKIGSITTVLNGRGQVVNTVTTGGTSVTSTSGNLFFDDTGLTADGTTAPTANTTAVMQLPIVQDLNVIQLAVPGNVAVTPKGTAGATSYSYIVAAASAVGLAPASAASTSTGNATLSTTNFNQITWNAVPGAAAYYIYRSVGGATQGLVGTVAASAALSFNDTGIAAITNVPGYVIPTMNTTGSATGKGPVFDGANIPTLNNAAGQTLTVTQLLNQILDRAGAGAAQTDTTPTAAAIVQACTAAQIQTGIYWVFRNRSANTVTLGFGTGVTGAAGNTNTIASNNARTYYIQITNVTPGSEAVTFWSINSGAF